jgi:hypothetical protein
VVKTVTWVHLQSIHKCPPSRRTPSVTYIAMFALFARTLTALAPKRKITTVARKATASKASRGVKAIKPVKHTKPVKPTTPAPAPTKSKSTGKSAAVIKPRTNPPGMNPKSKSKKRSPPAPQKSRKPAPKPTKRVSAATKKAVVRVKKAAVAPKQAAAVAAVAVAPVAVPKDTLVQDIINVSLEDADTFFSDLTTAHLTKVYGAQSAEPAIVSDEAVKAVDAAWQAEAAAVQPDTVVSEALPPLENTVAAVEFAAPSVTSSAVEHDAPVAAAEPASLEAPAPTVSVATASVQFESDSLLF